MNYIALNMTEFGCK